METCGNVGSTPCESDPPFVYASTRHSSQLSQPFEWHGQFRPDAQLLGTADELMVKLRAEETKRVKAVVLGGWFAVVEERELAEDESVKIYILRLSERVSM